MHPSLTINLSALRSNYRILCARHVKHSVAAVVKANAYGLGVEAASRALRDEGCREFFVATLEEAVELRSILPEAEIGVFQGLLAGEEKEYSHYRLTPVLNDIAQVERYLALRDGLLSYTRNDEPIAMLHIDTGMTRLGLSETDLKNPVLSKLQTQNSTLIISHLACANEPAHLKNTEQLARFREAIKYFPNAKASLANSSGIFLPPEFHFDIGRPGCALYGINPADGENPMQPVATLSAPILQIRTLDRGETIGYGATASAPEGSRIAIIGLGYADGYSRSLSNKGYAYVAGHRVPLIGRVSMDMVELDISAVPHSQITARTHAEFINSRQTVDDMAKACNSIGYEIFTRIGNRVRRIYK